MAHTLNTPWVLWYHQVNDPNFTKDSYTKVAEMATIEQFVKTFNNFPTFQKGMFYLMRKDTFPQWEDESNINGGYWSFKIPKTVVDESWKQLAASCVGECLTKKPEDMENINGISYSPKINNVIIKILNKHSDKNDAYQLVETLDNLHPEQSQYKAHIENKDEFVNQ